jgi:nicotinate-nucleotide adenylyltransferase
MRKIGILGGTFDPVHCGHLLMAQMATSQVALDRVIWVPDRSPPHKSRSSLASFEHRREMLTLAIADRPNFVLAPLLSNPSGTSLAIDTLLYLQNSHPDDRLYWIIGADAFQTLSKWHRCREIGAQCDWLVASRQNPGDGEGGSGRGGEWERGRGGVGEGERGGVGEGKRGGVGEGERGEWERRRGGEWEKMQVQTNAIGSRVAEQMALLDVQIQWQVLAMPAIDISSSQIRQYCREGRSIRYLVPEAVITYIAAHQLYRASTTANS